MKRYDSYKDSGVEWIGEIPSEWECIRLGMLGTFSSSGIDKKSNEDETPVRMVNYTDLIKGRKYYPIQNGQKKYMRVTTPQSKFKEHKLEKGDMVFIPSSETHEDLGYSSLIDFEEDDFVYSYHILRYKTKKPIYHYYKKYLINHHSVLNQFSSECKGTTRKIIGRDVFNNVRVVLPPLSEQQQIVSFLDTKTSLIDSLIEKTQRKIELLKEKRTSLINEVVTKGLNPNVEMKDSGVEWIGEIPSHWLPIPLKYFLEKNKDSIRTGPFGSTLKSSDMIESGIRIYNQRTVYDEDFSSGEIFVSDEKYQTMKSFTVLNGDILISSRGTIGKMTIVPEGSDIGVLHPCLIRLRVDQKKINKQFLWWYMNHSSLFLQSVKFESNSTTIDVIYSNVLNEVKFPVPTLSEQEEIISFLNEKIGVVDETISIERKRTELLKEYRQSLISEVVTGKLKVTTDE